MPDMQEMDLKLPPGEHPTEATAHCQSHDFLSMSQLDCLFQDHDCQADQLFEDSFHWLTPDHECPKSALQAPFPKLPPICPSGSVDICSWSSFPESMLLELPELHSSPTLAVLPKNGHSCRQSTGDILESPRDFNSPDSSSSMKRKQPSFGDESDSPLEVCKFDDNAPKTFKLVVTGNLDREKITTRTPTLKVEKTSNGKESRPPAGQTLIGSADALLTHPQQLPCSSTKVEFEVPKVAHAAVVCGPAVTLTQGEKGEFLMGKEAQPRTPSKRNKVTYRVRSNTLTSPKATREPVPAFTQDGPIAKEAVSLSEPQGPGTLKHLVTGVDMGIVNPKQSIASTKPLSLGPDQVVVNATKMASFLDQLQTIQAKMQVLQTQRENVNLQIATVRKAASLLEQTVAELNQVELKEESQTRLHGKSEEICALLSSVSVQSLSEGGEGMIAI